MRKFKEIFKRSWRKFFELGQRAGISVLPVHFYSEIPVIADLKKDPRWKAARSMAGVRGANLEEQVRFLKDCCPPELSQYLQTAMIFQKAVQANGAEGYGPIEADFLFAFITRFRPSKIVQIGCGLSTSVILQAAEKSQYLPSLSCIEPYPNDFLKKESLESRIQLIADKAQYVPLNVFTDLKRGDFLFVDSTHAVKPGSEVNRLIFEVLPRLSPGVYVHFHDVYFPYDYQRTLLSGELFFQNESALLQAFLTGNSSVSLRISLSMLHYARTEILRQVLPHYSPQFNDGGLFRRGGGRDFPSSVYLEIENH